MPKKKLIDCGFCSKGAEREITKEEASQLECKGRGDDHCPHIMQKFGMMMEAMNVYNRLKAEGKI